MIRANDDGRPQVGAAILPWPAHRPAQGGDNALFAVVDEMPVEDLAPTAALCIARLADTDDLEMMRRLLTTAGAAAIRLLDLIDADAEDLEPGGVRLSGGVS